MKYSIALTAALIPFTQVVSWSVGRVPANGLFMSPFVTCSPAAAMYAQQNAFAKRAFRQTCPQYQIINDEKQFQIAVDVPGVKLEDISVSVDENEQLLSIRGQRGSLVDSQEFTSKFSQSFSLGETVEIEKFTASLKDGVLIVTAPKDSKRVGKSARSIPITMVDTSDDTTVSVDGKQNEKTTDTNDSAADDKNADDTDKTSNN